MRRSAHAVISITAVLAVAACAPDSAERAPLVPTEPSFAVGDQCAGGLASTINKHIKEYFADPAEADLLNQFAVIKNLCPNAVPQMMNYLNAVASYGAPTTNGNTAQNLVNHWSEVVLYVKNEVKTWSPDVLMGDGALGGVKDGGAKLLGANGSMTTYDGRAALSLPGTIPSGGPFLFTFEPVNGSRCSDETSLKTNGSCYDVSDYPDGGTYNPTATISLCVHQPGIGTAGIGHVKTGFGTEVLPEVASSLSCAHDASTALNSWLGREAGPLGRAVARAYDYLRPRRLFADDAGESGSIGAFSLVGGVVHVIFSDDVDELDAIPDVGDSWTINATHPGYVQFQNSLGNLSGGIVVLSQSQGACTNCPVFSLLGKRVNSAEEDSAGTYEITWQSVQNKPSVKEGPFILFNKDSVEIARVSYVSRGSNDVIMFKAGNDSSDVANWTTDVAQSFKLTLSLKKAQAPATPLTVSLSIDGGAATTKAAPNATSLTQIGYVLTGIDAGIIGADNFRVTRIPDGPPPPP